VKIVLKDFQDDAVEAVLERLRSASAMASETNRQAVVLSAPTGAGKTVIATRVLERIIDGDDIAEPDPEATFLWITDLPELNQQTAEKMAATSEILGGLRLQIIDATFDQPAFAPGRVYFLNTQKLGTDKRLVTRGDGRTYSIWDTIERTIEEYGSSFYVVIDEAHRGMRSGGNGQASTIIQKFIKGSTELRPVPVVFGISATPRRFNDLLEGTNRGVQKWDVPVDEVRGSGLLKDRILLFHNDDDQPTDLTLLREATRHWVKYQERWAAYTTSQNEEPVQPILIVQVADKIKGDDLAAAGDAINDVLPAPIPSVGFAHSFDTGVAFDADSRPVRYLAPSRIVHDRDVRVVFFKTALSTGWDCPRAEVMMSFRTAKDATFIAQLIGRMVRTPLARRVESDETLNDVSLFLPHYDAKSLDTVIARLSDPDHDWVPPVDVEVGTDTIELVRAPGTEELFDAVETIPTYTIPRARRIRQTRRLLKLARALSDDSLEDNAVRNARQTLVKHLLDELDTKRNDPRFVDAVAGKQTVSFGLRTYDVRTGQTDRGDSGTLATSHENIDHLYQTAGRVLGDGLNVDLLDSLTASSGHPDAMRRAKIEIAVLCSYSDVRQGLDQLAETLVSEKRGLYHAQIDDLSDKRREVYREIAAMAPAPEHQPMRLPDILEWKHVDGAANWDDHLYVDEAGEFEVKLNGWETATLDAVSDEAAGWLRNTPRKPWALCIPYNIKGDVRPLYPDLLVLRRADGRILVDLYDPHDPGRDDAAPKAAGLARYAEDHGHLYGRIWLIADTGNGLRRLDIQDPATRTAVKAVTTSSELKTLYNTLGGGIDAT